MSLVLKISSKHIHVLGSSYATSIHDHGFLFLIFMVLATQVSVTKWKNLAIWWWEGKVRKWMYFEMQSPTK